MQIRAIDCDGRCDDVPVFLFEQMLAQGAVSAFFRESEQRWIIPGVDPMRIRNLDGSPRRRHNDSA
jgi:hypothetical protein